MFCYHSDRTQLGNTRKQIKDGKMIIIQGLNPLLGVLPA